MAPQEGIGAPQEPILPLVPLSYNSADSRTSALRLVLTLFPAWEHADGEIEFVRFTDGITNTLLKAVLRRPGATEEDMDAEAVLLRAYGSGTDVLIDRQREYTSHSLLSQHHLAPPLLARFQNGLLYRFIRGHVCTSSDLTRESIWRGVARRLGEWHAVLPVVGAAPTASKPYLNGTASATSGKPPSQKISVVPDAACKITTGKVTPNIWSVMQRWIHALPTTTEGERSRKASLQMELECLVRELSDLPGLGTDGLVFGHCDLLSGNVIRHPVAESEKTEGVETVSFIDYEYATPAPAAFDIANFFAEWGGLECDYSALPTRAQRRGFLEEYLGSYKLHQGKGGEADADVQRLFTLVDSFRGVPGFYWGIWALIQATISQIDFDYAAYAEVRLGEYWAWREESDGSRAAQGKEMPLREKRWAEGT
ncbi:MAG: hypothetical protein M1832_004799 [Thelocarpon impressellum]|nr:MAG: hypothetical protein M1832_004799 [Thelocarpon impressellum]